MMKLWFWSFNFMAVVNYKAADIFSTTNFSFGHLISSSMATKKTASVNTSLLAIFLRLSLVQILYIILEVGLRQLSFILAAILSLPPV